MILLISNVIEPASSINSRRSERTWSEREKISVDSVGRVGKCGGIYSMAAATAAPTLKEQKISTSTRIRESQN